jgi:predicted phosphate transport protein (TIGR00153 family)
MASRIDAEASADTLADGVGRRRLSRRLMRALRPVDRRFFPLFSSHAALATEALQTLLSLLNDVADAPGRVREVEALEKRADRVMDEVRAALARSMFPPFGRTVVYELANSIDNVLDLTEDAAQSLHLYHVTRVTPEAIRLAELALDSARRLLLAIGGLERMQAPQQMLRWCGEVDELESQADHVMRAAMSRLFREEPDARQMVKLKAVYELLESLTDSCKSVGSMIESLVLKHG